MFTVDLFSFSFGNKAYCFSDVTLQFQGVSRKDKNIGIAFLNFNNGEPEELCKGSL